MSSELTRWANFGECLLDELVLTHHGYSVRLAFDYIWVDADNGRTRGDLDERKHLVALELHAVRRLHMEGDLSQSMIDHPEEINWGLSEVAGVSAEPCENGIRLRISWEGNRHIEVEAGWVDFQPPDH